jgi:hypothetical protein
MRNLCIAFHDEGPDSFGRRRFTLFWDDPGGVFRPEPHPDDGEPVGHRRAQCFRTDPSRFSHATVVAEEGA